MLQKSSQIFITCLLLFLVPLFSIPLPISAQEWNLMDDYFFQYDEPEIILKPGSLKLFWSVYNYVPYGYKGRKLATTGSRIAVSAQLEISGESPKNLKYSWFLDNIFQSSKSGYGKDRFEFWVSKIGGDSHNVLLKVFNESKSFLVEESIAIPVFNPELVIYSREDTKIHLPYSIAIRDFDMFTAEKTSFLALPYFFDIKTLWDLEFKWVFANETYKESSLTANIFGLKITNKNVGGSLEEILKVSATNSRRPDQAAQKAVKLNIY